MTRVNQLRKRALSIKIIKRLKKRVIFIFNYTTRFTYIMWVLFSLESTSEVIENWAEFFSILVLKCHTFVSWIIRLMHFLNWYCFTLSYRNQLITSIDHCQESYNRLKSSVKNISTSITTLFNFFFSVYLFVTKLLKLFMDRYLGKPSNVTFYPINELKSLNSTGYRTRAHSKSIFKYKTFN